jgi:hypothetical protein
MDLGVGSFVFSQGLVSALPIVQNPAYLRTAALEKLRVTSWKVLPLIGMGLVRVLLVKGTNYPVSTASASGLTSSDWYILTLVHCRSMSRSMEFIGIFS